MRALLIGLMAILLLAGQISGKAQTNAPTVKAKTLLDVRAGHVTKLLRQESGKEDVPWAPLHLFRTVKYPSPAGELAAYVSYPPADGKKRPAVIWIFGGFGNGIDDTAWKKASPENDQSASAFRQAGLVLMFPSLRGGNKNPGVIEGFYGEVEDVLAARAYLAKQPFVDPQRIYLGGHSTGGTLVLLVAESTDQFRAIFAFGPVTDPASYGEEYLPYDRLNAKEAGLRAPVKWLDLIQNPTFILEGSQGNAFHLPLFASASRNPLVQVRPIKNANHFNILAPVTKLIANKIWKDTGTNSNLRITPAELEQVMKK